jgi:hypothetical protein
MNLMNKICMPYLDKFVIVFVDDILINSKDKEEYAKHLWIALQILREHQLYAKFSKCEFWLDQVEFLGHVISKEGIAVNPSKVASVMEWEALKNVKQIRGFLEWQVTRVNSTNVQDEGLRIGGIGHRMNSKVKIIKRGAYRE